MSQVVLKRLFLCFLVYLMLALPWQNSAALAVDGQESVKTSANGQPVNPQEKGFVERFLKAADYIPTDEIKPGMEGYGLTVFQGTKVEKFPCKVIGVVKQVLAGRDAILIRVGGPHMAKNNVIRGMSGSPIYINGRLAGALSYGFDFSKEPIVGVTPVVDMLDALTFDSVTGAPRHISKNYPRLAPVAVDISSGVVGAAGSPKMVPLLAPVSLSGFSGRAQEYLAGKLKDSGMAVSSGATGGLDKSLADNFDHDKSVVPGGAVSVMLSTGDFSGAATGTATCTFGNKFIAFGHSFLESGGVSFPLASAYVHEVLPSLSVSFKLASPLEVIGTIFADRPWSVGGEVGRTAELIPMTITVQDEERAVRKVYKCNVVQHPELTHALVTASVMSAMDSTYQSQAPYVVRVKSDIDVVGQGQIQRTDRFPVNFPAHLSGSASDLLAKLKLVREPISGFVGGMVDRVLDNDFEDAKIKQIKVEMTIESGRKVSRIERVFLDRSTVRPGESVDVHCVMKPFSGPNYAEKLTFTVPRDLPDGDMAIGICGGDELEMLRKRMGVADPAPENLTQIIARLRKKERSDKLCGLLALPRQSLVLNGEVLRNPPAQWIKPFFSDRATRPPHLVRAEERVTHLMDDIVDGGHIVAINVKRQDRAFTKPLPYTVNPPGQGGADGIFVTEQARKALDSIRKSEPASSPPASSGSSGGVSVVISASSSSSSASSAPAASTPAPAVAVASSSETSKSSAQTLLSSAQSYPHIRAMNVWRQDQEDQLRNGTADGVIVDSFGRLTPGFRELERCSPDAADEPRIFASGYYQGTLYFCAGSNLYAFKSGDKSVHKLANLGGLFISSMCIDTDGTIYAVQAGKGRVLAVKVNGASVSTNELASVNEDIISAITLDAAGNLYMGVSGTGKLYRIKTNAPGKAELVLDSSQAHITALHYSRFDNKLYVGTAERGVVYSLAAGAGKLTAEYETGEHIVTGIARDKAGNLYVTTAGQGKLFYITPGAAQVDTIAVSDAFYTLYYDSRDDRVYSGDAEGDITRVEIDPLTKKSYFLPVCHTEQEAVLSLCGDQNGKLYVCTTNVAQVRVFQVEPAGQPSYASTIFDAGKNSIWSKLRLSNGDGLSDSNLSTHLRVETRSGASAQPDESWGPWIEAALKNEGDGPSFLVSSAAGRYLQYKLTWKPDAFPGDTKISAVEVSYQPGNSAPTISTVSLKGGDSISGESNISLVGSDNDSDNLLLAVEISKDNGKTWELLKGDLRSRSADDKAKKRKGKKDKDREKGKVTETKTVKEVKEIKRTEIENKDDQSKKDLPNAPKMPEPKSEDPPPKPLEKEKLDSGSGIKIDEEAPTLSGYTEGTVEELPEGAIIGEEEGTTTTTNKAGEAYSSSEKFNYKFDSKKQKDGRYIMRFTLSDRPSNARGYESALVVKEVLVDNTPPKVDEVKITRLNDKRINIRIKTQDTGSAIADATYKVEGYEPFSLGARAGSVADGTTLELEADQVFANKPGKKLTVEVFDRAGNKTKVERTIP